MAILNLSDRLLHADGIAEKLKEIQLDLQKIPGHSVMKAFHKKLADMRHALKFIFFDGMQDKEVKALLSSPDSCFRPDYLSLEKALSIIFSDELEKAAPAETLPIVYFDKLLEDSIASIMLTKSTTLDWRPNDEFLAERFAVFNQEHSYFTAENLELMKLFKNLFVACRKLSVLIEKNSTPGDALAYDFAYKLLALLVCESEPIPSFEHLSSMIEKLVTPRDKVFTPGDKIFQQHLRELSLPKNVSYRTGWLTFINQFHYKALPYFIWASEIEGKLNRAPRNIKEADDTYKSLTHKRALEDSEWYRLCQKYKAPVEIFNAGLDFMGTVWPKKHGDSIPDISIEYGEFIWVKLSPSDKVGLVLGRITYCCQSIGDLGAKCVIDAMSLDSNALYVLVKKINKASEEPLKKPNGSINIDHYDIIAQAYIWYSTSHDLVLDSIEYSVDKIKPDDIREILTLFGEKVIADNESVKRVTCGKWFKPWRSRGGFLYTMPKKPFIEVPIPEKMLEGFFYGDAETQFLIASRKSQLAVKDEETLRASYSKIFCDCICYLNDHLSDSSNFTERLSELIILYPTLPQVFTIQALHRLFRFTGEPSVIDLQLINFDDLHSLLERGTLSTACLMWQANTPEKIIKALPFIRDEDRFAAVIEKIGDQSVMNFAAEDPQLLDVILSLLPKEIAFVLRERCQELNKNFEDVLACAFSIDKFMKTTKGLAEPELIQGFLDALIIQNCKEDIEAAKKALLDSAYESSHTFYKKKSIPSCIALLHPYLLARIQSPPPETSPPKLSAP
ncbi:MAG: hypothetical protein EBY16_05630 [Gammaproteobacteria bacterium]|nr:hypothetical protein [Gammaproteobacteria bacterium]